MQLVDEVLEALDESTRCEIESSRVSVVHHSIDHRSGEHVVKLVYRYRLDDRYVSQLDRQECEAWARIERFNDDLHELITGYRL